MNSKDWSTKKEKRPVFDILSTVKKSQKRSAPEVPQEPPFKLYIPPSADVDEDIDKENIPISYERQFSRPSTSQHTTTTNKNNPNNTTRNPTTQPPYNHRDIDSPAKEHRPLSERNRRY